MSKEIPDVYFGKFKETSAEQYLEMWLSEQIPTYDWLEILKENKDVRELYNKNLERKNV